MYHMLLFYQLSFTCYSSIINYTIALFIALINFHLLFIYYQLHFCFIHPTNLLYHPTNLPYHPTKLLYHPTNLLYHPTNLLYQYPLILWKVPRLAVKRDSRKLNKNKQTGMIKVRTYSHIPALSPFLACRAPRHFTDDEGKL